MGGSLEQRWAKEQLGFLYFALVPVTERRQPSRIDLREVAQTGIYTSPITRGSAPAPYGTHTHTRSFLGGGVWFRFRRIKTKGKGETNQQNKTKQNKTKQNPRACEHRQPSQIHFREVTQTAHMSTCASKPQGP